MHGVCCVVLRAASGEYTCVTCVVPRCGHEASHFRVSDAVRASALGESRVKLWARMGCGGISKDRVRVISLACHRCHRREPVTCHVSSLRVSGWRIVSTSIVWPVGRVPAQLRLAFPPTMSDHVTDPELPRTANVSEDGHDTPPRRPRQAY